MCKVITLLFSVFFFLLSIDLMQAMEQENKVLTVQSEKLSQDEIRRSAEVFLDDLIKMNDELEEDVIQRIKKHRNDLINDILMKKELSLSEYGLKILPESIGGLVNLTYLNLANNKLQSLPESIGGLVNLTYLNLANNELQSLPDPIEKLVNLNYLGLSDNQLRLLPASVGNFVKLETLYISGNQISVLPSTIGNIVSLKQFGVDDTPLMGFNGQAYWDQLDVQKYAQSLKENIAKGAAAKEVFTKGVEGTVFEELPMDVRNEILRKMAQKSAEAEDLRK